MKLNKTNNDIIDKKEIDIMALNIAKGEKHNLNLSKDRNELLQVSVGLGWDMARDYNQLIWMRLLFFVQVKILLILFILDKKRAKMAV